MCEFAIVAMLAGAISVEKKALGRSAVNSASPRPVLTRNAGARPRACLNVRPRNLGAGFFQLFGLFFEGFGNLCELVCFAEAFQGASLSLFQEFHNRLLRLISFGTNLKDCFFLTSFYRESEKIVFAFENEEGLAFFGHTYW